MAKVAVPYKIRLVYQNAPNWLQLLDLWFECLLLFQTGKNRTQGTVARKNTRLKLPQWRIQARRLGGQSNRGAPKSLHRLNCSNIPWFSATIVGYHTKVVARRPRKWLFLLVELCNLSGN